MNSPPKLRVCSKCPHNIGDFKSGLCASCDPNHRWWKQPEDESETNKVIEKISKIVLEPSKTDCLVSQ